MERLNFNHLYYFYIVAKEGSIKAASEKLFVSQPTISDQIKLLEDYFDCQLFERRNRSLFLSTEGEFALNYAEGIFSQGRELTRRLRNQIQIPKKSIDIGVTHFMSHHFLYETILPLFNQDEIVVNVKEGQKHLLLADLEEENLDMVFTDGQDLTSSSMSSYRIGVNKTYVVAHKKYQKYKKGFPESLAKLPFFNYTKNSYLKYEIELFFSKNSITPKVIGEGDDRDLMEMVTVQGLAFTIVPEAAKQKFCTNKNLIVLGEIAELQTSVWGIIKKNYTGYGYQLLKNKL